MPRSNYYRNKKHDLELRGVAYTDPTTWYLALATAADRTGATEQTGGGVARVAVPCSTANWSATQSEGSTAAESSGTSGLSSNNNALQFAAAASAEISASWVVFYDASSGGNMCRYYRIRDSEGNPITRTWQAGDPVVIDAGDLEITLG